MQKESELCSTELEQSRIEETHATQFEFRMDPVYLLKEVILVGERKWDENSACEFLHRDPRSAEISKLVMRMVRHHDQG